MCIVWDSGARALAQGSTKIRGVKLDAVTGDPGVSGHGAYESRPGAKLPSSIDPTDFGTSSP